MRKLYILIYCMTLLSLSSCLTTEKALDFLKKQDALAGICAEEYPVEEELKRGTPTVERDTVFVAGEELECPETTDQKTGKVYVPKVQCPPQKTIKEVITRVDTLVKENTARITALQQEVNNLKASLLGEKEAHLVTASKASEHQRDFWLILILLIVSLLWVKVKESYKAY